MQNLHIEVLSISHILEETPEGTSQQLHELLFYPEFCSFGNKTETLQKNGKRIAKDITQRSELNIFSQRSLPVEINQNEIFVEIEALDIKHNARTTSLTLTLHYLHWISPDKHLNIYLPSLGIEVITTEKRFEEDLRNNINFHLKRTGISKNLFALSQLARTSEIKVERLAWNPEPLTSTDYHKKHYEPEGNKPNVLKEIGSEVMISSLKKAFGKETEVSQLLAHFKSKTPASILLVGPSGCGKSATLNEFIRLHKSKLGRVWETSGSRLIAGQSGFGMWQKRCRDLIEEISKDEVLLLLGNLFELNQVGQSSCSTESIASFLRPYLMRGEIVIVTECTTDQYSAIETQDPRILDAFKLIHINEPSKEKTLEILTAQRDDHYKRSVLPDDCVNLIHSLHNRFARYSAKPGKALQFLNSLIDQAPLNREEAIGKPYTQKDIVRQFSSETGLPTVILDSKEEFIPDKITTWFDQYVKAQPQAVEKVVSMLTAVKTRLSRPNKPLGSFMFIGPTGVGKTELAKTLALYLYGDKDRIVRFDMSEYNSPQAAQRLVSDSFSQSEGLLTSAVREQPFSIILLDEFEKASPEVYDLFLQVLGEGRLTDGSGRLADFSNTIVIMTSNLGASSYGRAELGFASNSTSVTSAAVHFTDAVKKEVRPEFFNRIDHIVPFSPLTLDSVKKVAQRELELIKQRDGINYRNLRLEIQPELLEGIISKEYDRRYGARLLKRSLEAHLLLPLSKYLNENPHQERGTLHFTTQQNKTIITFSHVENDTDSSEILKNKKTQLINIIKSLSNNRHLLNKLSKSSILGELRSEIARIEQRMAWERKKTVKQYNRTNINRRKKKLDSVYIDFDPIEQARLETLKLLVNEVEKIATSVTALEERSLLSLYNNINAPLSYAEGEDTTTNASINDEDIEQLILKTFSTYENKPSKVTLYFLSDDFNWMNELITVYTKALTRRNATLKLGVIYRSPPEELTREVNIDSNSLNKTSEKLASYVLPEILNLDTFHQISHKKGEKFTKSIKGLALFVKSDEAYLLLGSEAGLHTYEFEQRKYHRCLISRFDEDETEFCLPLKETQQMPALKNLAIRRQFSFEAKYSDSHLSEKGDAIFNSMLLEKLLCSTFKKAAHSILD